MVVPAQKEVSYYERAEEAKKGHHYVRGSQQGLIVSCLQQVGQKLSIIQTSDGLFDAARGLAVLFLLTKSINFHSCTQRLFLHFGVQVEKLHSRLQTRGPVRQLTLHNCLNSFCNLRMHPLSAAMPFNSGQERGTFEDAQKKGGAPCRSAVDGEL